MNIRLPFGTDVSPVDVPDNWINGRCYRPHQYEADMDAHATLSQALAKPLGDKSFEDVALGRSNAVVVVDSQQPSLFDEVVPLLLEQLESVGRIESSEITILLTNSFWNPLSTDRVDKIVPQPIRTRYDVHLHNPSNAKMSKEAGALADGTSVHMNELYLESDLKILVGPVYPDVILGYRGGASLILSGLLQEASAARIYSYERVSDKAVNYAQLHNNPIHAAALQAMMLARPDFAISSIHTRDSKVSELYVGDVQEAFHAAVTSISKRYNIRLKEPMDICLTAAGGSPWDSSLTTVVESVAAAVPILKDGGTIIVCAGLEDGFGQQPLRELFEGSKGPRSFKKAFSKGNLYYPGQWIVQRFYDILMHHEVLIQTNGLTDDEVWNAGMTPIPNLGEGIEVAMMDHGQRCKICALPDGPFNLATLEDGIHTSHY